MYVTKIVSRNRQLVWLLLSCAVLAVLFVVPIAPYEESAIVRMIMNAVSLLVLVVCALLYAGVLQRNRLRRKLNDVLGRLPFKDRLYVFSTSDLKHVSVTDRVVDYSVKVATYDVSEIMAFSVNDDAVSVSELIADGIEVNQLSHGPGHELLTIYRDTGSFVDEMVEMRRLATLLEIHMRKICPTP